MKKVFQLNENYAVLLHHTELKTVQFLAKWLEANLPKKAIANATGDTIAKCLTKLMGDKSHLVYYEGAYNYYCNGANRLIYPIFLNDKYICTIGKIQDIIEISIDMQ